MLLIRVVFGEERRIGLPGLVDQRTNHGLIEQIEIEHLILTHVENQQTVGSHLARLAVEAKGEFAV